MFLSPHDTQLYPSSESHLQKVQEIYTPERLKREMMWSDMIPV